MTETVTSADGTPIAIYRSGEGPLIVIAVGALSTGKSSGSLMKRMPGFSFVTYDRRDRGESGNTEPYARQREIEDLAAVINAAGGGKPVMVYGHSTGAVLAIEALLAGSPVSRLAVCEAPYFSNYTDRTQDDFIASAQAALAAGDKEEVLRLFFERSGYTDEEWAELRAAKYWPSLEDMAYTIPQDMITLDDAEAPLEQMKHIDIPVIAMGGDNGRGWPVEQAERIAGAVPNATFVIFDGEAHNPSNDKLAPVLNEFFAA